MDAWWAARLNMPDLTPRLVLQKWGTEVARRSWHDDIWIASLENKLRKTTDDIVISDCRFPNEIKAVRDAGGVVIRVVRGDEPVWYSIAKRANKGDIMAQQQLKDFNIHPSETAWVGTNFDAVIDNNADGLDNLYQQVKNLVQDLQAAKADPVF